MMDVVMAACRLCGSNALAILETIHAEKLKACYGFDTTRFFPDATVELLGCLDCGLRTFDRAIPGDSDFYDKLQLIPKYYEGDKAEFEHALATIAAIKPTSVLDVGAGCGLFLRKLLRVAGLRVRASELSERSLNTLRTVGIGIDQESDKYDFVCSFQVFEHVSDLQSMMDFVDSKLLSGGTLLISVPNPESPLFRDAFCYLDYPPHHINRFTKKGLESLGHCKNYVCVDYWREGLRIEHFATAVNGRRKKLLAAERFPKLKARLASLFDIVLLPALHDPGNGIGHSHTMVYRKPV